jgi:solute carrier family 25 oxoglutarate transporter 11
MAGGLLIRMVIAALSGMGAATVCHPLDVIRIQMQTEGAHYKNAMDCAQQLYKKEGLKNGLYAGISAAYLRQWLYGSCRIGIYAYLLEQAQLDNIAHGLPKNDIPFMKKLVMGCTSGGIGSFVGTPSELALVRMGADSQLPMTERRNYKSVTNCISRIAQEEGPLLLWRGATPTVLRAMLLSACAMGMTSEMKHILTKTGYFGNEENLLWHGLPVLFLATLVSSFAANIVANPFDVVKSRMQNMEVTNKHDDDDDDGTTTTTNKYSSMMDCFFQIVTKEGIWKLWAGFTPAFLKLAPYTVISLMLADKITMAVMGKAAV